MGRLVTFPEPGGWVAVQPSGNVVGVTRYGLAVVGAGAVGAVTVGAVGAGAVTAGRTRLATSVA